MKFKLLIILMLFQGINVNAKTANKYRLRVLVGSKNMRDDFYLMTTLFKKYEGSLPNSFIGAMDSKYSIKVIRNKVLLSEGKFNFKMSEALGSNVSTITSKDISYRAELFVEVDKIPTKVELYFENKLLKVDNNIKQISQGSFP